ncbi:hypothetical protein QYE76_055362 [Lolium multiflorum]|uniref:CCHC-type domain-containing protein n=1 Tax=Lolium multiflorum TaxID=4521 RepID=A0AAD8T191_LOLMU|nr:hypothetical protein QYE76_055362 [Lolium multiflorum]
MESSGSSSLNYADTICEGYGEPGHLKAACSKGACCFICKASNHAVDDCPVLKRPHQIARYIGSSANGLGFYHIEAPETGKVSSTTVLRWLGWKYSAEIPIEFLLADCLNFHGKLFQLQFTAETPIAIGVQREVLTWQDSGNAGGGLGNGTNNMDTDGRSEANRNTTNSQSSGCSNQQVEIGNASHGRQVTLLTADTSEEGVLPGSEVYKLLMEKGAIGTDGQFIWDDYSNADEGVKSEVTSFWNEDDLSFAERMEEDAAEQLHLPEDIMLAFDDVLKNREAQ